MEQILIEAGKLFIITIGALTLCGLVLGITILINKIRSE